MSSFIWVTHVLVKIDASFSSKLHSWFFTCILHFERTNICCDNKIISDKMLMRQIICCGDQFRSKSVHCVSVIQCTQASKIQSIHLYHVNCVWYQDGFVVSQQRQSRLLTMTVAGFTLKTKPITSFTAILNFFFFIKSSKSKFFGHHHWGPSMVSVMNIILQWNASFH